MAEDVVGQLQEIGVGGYHADLTAFLGRVFGHCLLEFPAIVEAGHGIPLRQSLQNVPLLLMHQLLTFQSVDEGFQVKVLVAEIGELLCQQGQGAQDILKFLPGL